MGDHNLENVHPSDLKLGWLPSDANKMRLYFRDILNSNARFTIPADVDYISHVTDWDMALNDQISCCTASAFDHMMRALSLLGQGVEDRFTDDDVLKFYEGSTGYNPSDSNTDQGGVMTDVLSYARSVGMAGHRIDGYAKVHPHNVPEVKTALYLTGSLYVGMDFPDSAMQQFRTGMPWDVVRGAESLGGHCVHVGRIDATGNWYGTSWGRVVKMTPAFVQAYIQEVEAPLSAEWIKSGTSGSGIDVVTLNSLLQQLTGQPGGFTVTNPTPTPAPFPAPAPVPAPAPAPVLAPTPAPHSSLPADVTLVMHNTQLTLRALDRRITALLLQYGG